MNYGNSKATKLGGYRFKVSSKLKNFKPRNNGPFLKVELPRAIIDCEIKDFINELTVDNVVTKASSKEMPAQFAKLLTHEFSQATIDGSKVVKGSIKAKEQLMVQPTKMVPFMLNQIYMPGDFFYLYTAYPGDMKIPEGYQDLLLNFNNAPPEKRIFYLNEILNALRKDKVYAEELQSYIANLSDFLEKFFLNSIGLLGRKKANYLKNQVMGAISVYKTNTSKYSIFEYLLKNNYRAGKRNYVVRNPFKVVSNMILSTEFTIPLFLQDSKLLPDPDYVRFNKKATSAKLYQLVNLSPTVMYYRPLY
jgi:hypothetical protein